MIAPSQFRPLARVAGVREPTDGDLLKQAATDPAAFRALYERYEVIVTGYLIRRTRNAELTAELAAETFATALLNAKRFRDDGRPAIGWLLGIARNLMLRSWEAGRAEQRARARLGVQRVQLSDDSLERVEALLDLGRADNPLHAALAALPPEESAAIAGRVLDERSYEELAREFGIGEAAVRQRVSRGLRRLRMELKGGNDPC
jgi:RNA polymerase sigma-70 factor (ECF subfamily)